MYRSNCNLSPKLLLLPPPPLAVQPTVGFGLSNNVLPFFSICHQLSPSSHSQHLKISFYFLSPYFPGSSPTSRPFQFLSEDIFGRPINEDTPAPLLMPKPSSPWNQFHDNKQSQHITVRTEKSLCSSRNYEPPMEPTVSMSSTHKPCTVSYSETDKFCSHSFISCSINTRPKLVIFIA